MFGPFRGLRRPDTKQTIAIAVKYPMKSAAIVISTSITPVPVCKDAARTGEKLCPMSQQKIGGEIELFPAHSWQRDRDHRSPTYQVKIRSPRDYPGWRAYLPMTAPPSRFKTGLLEGSTRFKIVRSTFTKRPAA